MKAPTVRTFDEDMVKFLIKEMRKGKYKIVAQYIDALQNVISMQQQTNVLAMKKIRELSK